MTTVTVHGSLAVAVGKSVWRLSVSTPAEAFRAIDANCNGKLIDFMLANKLMEFRVVVNGKDIQAISQFKDLRYAEMKTIDILPVLQGSGNAGGWLALIGIIIIAAVLFLPSGGASSGWAAIQAGGLGALSTTSSLALTVGVALTLSGVSQMLYPSVSADTKEKQANQPSYIFDGPVNAYRQGQPIPVGFGLMRVGSQVIAGGVRAVDIPFEEETT